MKRVNPEVLGKDSWEVIRLDAGDRVVGAVELTGERRRADLHQQRRAAAALPGCRPCARRADSGAAWPASGSAPAPGRVLRRGPHGGRGPTRSWSPSPGSSRALPGTEVGSVKVTPFGGVSGQGPGDRRRPLPPVPQGRGRAAARLGGSGSGRGRRGQRRPGRAARRRTAAVTARGSRRPADRRLRVRCRRTEQFARKRTAHDDRTESDSMALRQARDAATPSMTCWPTTRSSPSTSISRGSTGSPTPGSLMVTCMDSRIVPLEMVGLTGRRREDHPHTGRPGHRRALAGCIAGRPPARSEPDHGHAAQPLRHGRAARTWTSRRSVKEASGEDASGMRLGASTDQRARLVHGRRPPFATIRM